ncbi:MAG: lysylphosphatidylglycerol synthase transmembrane domain-containing protein [Candidatus Hodarchaeales archaeon]|jgi:uncharacterized protein (TIRG00374 family)
MVQLVFGKRNIFYTIIAFILLAIYFHYLGFQGVINALSEISPIFILLLVTIQLTSYFSDSLAWKYLLHTVDITPSTRKVYSVYLASFGYGLLLPSMHAVETTIRVELGRKNFGNSNHDEDSVSSSAILSSIVLHKMLGGLVGIVVLLAVSYSLVVYFGMPLSWAIVFICITSFFIISSLSFILAISLNPERTSKVVKRMLHGLTVIFPPLKRRQALWEKKIDAFVMNYYVNFKILVQNKRQASIAGCFVFCATLLSWTNAYVFTLAIGGDLDFWAMIATGFMASTLNSLPLGIPGMEGIKEIVVSEALRRFISSHKSAALAILFSFVKFYVPVTLAVIISLVLRRKSQQTRKANDSSLQNSKSQVPH